MVGPGDNNSKEGNKDSLNAVVFLDISEQCIPLTTLVLTITDAWAHESGAYLFSKAFLSSSSIYQNARCHTTLWAVINMSRRYGDGGISWR
jgi:hypothetical protein